MDKKTFSIGFGFTGSFCNMKQSLAVLEQLAKEGHRITCFVTPDIVTTTTRYGSYRDFRERMVQITHNPPVETIANAEVYGPQIPLDLVILCPTTATSLSKLVHGIYDNAVLMMTKAHLRNQKPVVVGAASNDLLGISGVNLMKLLTMKNFYLVPLGQDDYKNKPTSLVCDFDQVIPTMNEAMNHTQIQPLLISYEGRKK